MFGCANHDCASPDKTSFWKGKELRGCLGHGKLKTEKETRREKGVRFCYPGASTKGPLCVISHVTEGKPSIQ